MDRRMSMHVGYYKHNIFTFSRFYKIAIQSKHKTYCHWFIQSATIINLCIINLRRSDT